MNFTTSSKSCISTFVCMYIQRSPVHDETHSCVVLIMKKQSQNIYLLIMLDDNIRRNKRFKVQKGASTTNNGSPNSTKRLAIP